MLTRAALVICLTAFLAQLCFPGEQAAALPQWLLEAIEANEKSVHPGSFEEESYEGTRVFQFTRGDWADTGDEHILFSEDGKEICKFGGFVGHVTSGVCDIHNIVYVRTL
jgi:hypothetical protein